MERPRRYEAVQQAEAALQKAVRGLWVRTQRQRQQILPTRKLHWLRLTAKAQDALATSTSNASVAMKSIPVAVATETAVTDAQSALDALLKKPTMSTKTQIDAAKVSVGFSRCGC